MAKHNVSFKVKGTLEVHLIVIPAKRGMFRVYRDVNMVQFKFGNVILREWNFHDYKSARAHYDSTKDLLNVKRWVGKES